MIFQEDSHSYTNEETNEKYLSVTSFIGSFSKKQNWKKIASNYLKKHLEAGTLISDLSKKWGITLKQGQEKWGGQDYSIEWVLEVWNENSDRANSGGTAFHNFMELKDAQDENVVYNPLVKGKKRFLELSELGHKTYLELGIGSHLHKLWGQADKIIFLNDTDFSVRDYKTNKDRSKIDPIGKAFYDKVLKRKVVKKFLPPLSKVQDHEYWKYALQLSLYAYMLELYGYVCKGLYVDYVHTKYIKPDKFNPSTHIELAVELDLDRIRIVDTSKGEKGIEEIKMPYLKEEVKAMLKFRQLNL